MARKKRIRLPERRVREPRGQCPVCGKPLKKVASTDLNIGPACLRKITPIVLKVKKDLGMSLEQAQEYVIELCQQIRDGSKAAFEELRELNVPLADRVKYSSQWEDSPKGKWRKEYNRKVSEGKRLIRALGKTGYIDDKRALRMYYKVHSEEKPDETS